jgi:pimeloyl-ACP methyl ester carboxylesterase
MVMWKMAAPMKSLLVNKWRVEYLEFRRRETEGRPAIVILGGAFQRFDSFRRDVEILQEHYPVYVVDLPGQGGNQQLAPNLTYVDFALLLKGFVDRLDLKSIIPIGLSFNAAIAYHFACQFPYSTSRVILTGVTPTLRPSMRLLLLEALSLLKRQRFDEFSQGVVLNLMNYSRRREIRGSELLARGLYRTLKSMTESDRTKFEHNLERYLKYHALPEQGPTMETLVVAGEWDHFTTPFEAFTLARRCPRGVLAIVAEADHLAPYLRKEMINQTYLAFLNGDRLHSRTGLIVYRQLNYPESLRQMEPRHLVRQEAYLEERGGVLTAVKLEDFNIQGCRLRLGGVERTMMKESNLKLYLPGAGISLGLLPFREDALTITALFKRTQFKLMHDMENFLKEQTGT